MAKYHSMGIPKIVQTPESIRKDKTGDKFGRLLVIGFHNYGPAGRVPHWVCLCTGPHEPKFLIVRGGNLVTGHTRSCGCLTKGLKKPPTKHHGMSKQSEWKIWSSMRHRCCNPNTPAYENYGGRGITICESWQQSYLNFFEDMGPRPSKNHSLDRIDNDGPYSPDNCRWATRGQQSRNRRNNRVIESNGERHCLATWARLKGIGRDTLANRLDKGWDIADALQTPVGQKSRTMIEYRGETRCISDWAQVLNINAKLLSKRLSAGWPPDRAFTEPTAWACPIRRISHNGETHSLGEWAKITGVPRSTLFQRLERGWTFEEAISLPARARIWRGKIYEHAGEKLSIAEWAKKLDIPIPTLKSRLQKGWSVERTLSTPSPRRAKRNHFCSSHVCDA